PRATLTTSPRSPSESTSCRRITSTTSLLPVAHVGQEGDLAGALHRDCDLPLVAAAGAADPPRADLPALRDVPAQPVDVLVVDLVDLRLAEEAGLAPCAPGGSAALRPARAFGLRCCQGLLSLERDVVVGGLEIGVGRRLGAGRDELVLARAAAFAAAA